MANLRVSAELYEKLKQAAVQETGRRGRHVSTQALAAELIASGLETLRGSKEGEAN